MRLTTQELGVLQREYRRRPQRSAARGPLTAFLLEHLVQPVHDLPVPPPAIDDPLDGDDAAFALY